MIRGIRFITVVSLLLFGGAADAAIYYVATTGSDSNPGTVEQPFGTLSHGVGLLGPGDTLYVRGGMYNERVSIWDKIGTSSDPIYITNYPGEEPVIDGTGTDRNEVVAITESAYIRFDGFEVRNGPKHGILVYDSNHIKLRWNDVHSNQRGGILVSGADRGPIGTTHHVLVQENDVHHNVLENETRSMATGWAQALTASRAADVDIVGNLVHENYGEGIDYMSSDGGTLVGNTVYDNYSVNIYLDNAQYAKIDGNFVITGWSSTPEAFYRNDAPAIGIAAANEYRTAMNPLTDLTITNNIVVRCRYGFMYWNGEYGGGLHNTVIANNTFSRSTQRALHIENGSTELHDTTTIENNIIHATSGTDYAFDPSSTIVYLTNCWYNGNAGTHRGGTGDVMADPLLVNANGWSKSDFKLTSSSPCIDAGTAEPLVTTDFWVTSRSGVHYDIGAHEY